MKVRALASLSGPTGRSVAGDEFVVDAQLGAELIKRGVAEEVIPEPAPVEEVPAAKPVKIKATAKE
ncbi:hypothetical protein [Pseudomonas umsongensis]|uniref:hypothetical protein n=1 Tax=Pseudomonas umsongensis TaxID=198618 RepID=UPI00200A9A6B|nr:hypothetical protein [Pseudomonas umsongensis]MCK8685363.1 hypothetical protein [Pseudomonas umsongensis]